MTKLKTLKDMKENKEIHHVCAFAIKEEAIKWVKELDENIIDMYQHDYGEELIDEFYDYQNDTFIQVRNWIKHFFNITEDDLK